MAGWGGPARGCWREIPATERGWSLGRGRRCWTCFPQIFSPSSSPQVAILQMSKMIGGETRLFTLWWSSGESGSVKGLVERDRVWGRGPCSTGTGPTWPQGHRQGGCSHRNPALHTSLQCFFLRPALCPHSHLLGIFTDGKIESAESLGREDKQAFHSAHVLQGWRERTKSTNLLLFHLTCTNVSYTRGVSKNVERMLRQFFGRTSVPCRRSPMLPLVTQNGEGVRAKRNKMYWSEF